MLAHRRTFQRLDRGIEMTKASAACRGLALELSQRALPGGRVTFQLTHLSHPLAVMSPVMYRWHVPTSRTAPAGGVSGVGMLTSSPQYTRLAGRGNPRQAPKPLHRLL